MGPDDWSGDLRSLFLTLPGGAENRENRFLALLGRPWVALGFFFVAFCCSWVLLRAPPGSERAPGLILGGILARFGMIFRVFPRFFPGAFCGTLSVCFRCVFGLAFDVFGRARHKAEERKVTHPPRENCFFQGARSRRRRRKGDDRKPGKTPKISMTNYKK